MRTVNKTPKEVTTSGLKNYSRYFNQGNFTGIKHSDNPIVSDKYSFSEANNIYVDDENRLSSRLPLITDETNTYENIVDIFTYGDNKIYVTKNATDDTKFDIILETKNTLMNTAITTLSNIEKYHITHIDNYIICFNNDNAQVFDINDNKGWLPLKNYANIPVTKSIVGTDVNEYEGNLFTKDYEEDYIYKDGIYPTIPSYVTNANIGITTASGAQPDYSATDVTQFTDYKICKKLGITLQSTDLFDVKYKEGGNIVVIAKQYYMLLSLNNGDTFVKVDYPQGLVNPYHCAIDDIVQNIFFIASNGVYRYCIGYDEYHIKWTYFSNEKINTDNRQLSSGIYLSRFINGNDDTIAFAFLSVANQAIYFITMLENTYLKCLKITDFPDYMISKNTYDNSPFYKDVCKMIYDRLPDQNDDTLLKGLALDFCIFDGLGLYTKYQIMFSDISSVYNFDSDDNTRVMCGEITEEDTVEVYITESYHLPITAKFIMPAYTKIDIDNTINYFYNIQASNHLLITGTISGTVEVRNVKQFDTVSQDLTSVPMRLEQLYIYASTLYRDKEILSELDYVEIFSLPVTGTRRQTIVTDDYYYIIMQDGTVYTNKLSVYTNNLSKSDIVTIKYKKIFSDNENKYTEVPDVSLSGTELMLAFGNETNITNNVKDKDGNLKLSMQNLNLQKYIKPITNLVQISTTEIAIFFENDIKICSKVEDSNQASSYRYDYYNTKLSTGVRLGDDVINTLEGSLTLFPTRRGLASLNYQAFMATTDQVIQYISDDIKDIWNEFYNNSNNSNNKNNIKILQYIDKIILANGTGTILLFDLLRASWYKWNVPVNTIKLFTDQIDLRLLSNVEDYNLCIFKFKDNTNNYKDYIADDEYNISWDFTSNLQNFDAPTYYKNLKQLVFQLCDDEDKVNDITAKIRLYRKQITDSNPEEVKFNIDKYGTIVKRFNYWKINVLQWGLSNNKDFENSRQLKMSMISIKYEISDEVR